MGEAETTISGWDLSQTGQSVQPWHGWAVAEMYTGLHQSVLVPGGLKWPMHYTEMTLAANHEKHTPRLIGHITILFTCLLLFGL
jgi:hypothetical protein